MGTYTKEQIVTAVKKALDENTETAALTEDTDTLELEDIIERSIPDGINAVRLVAPISRVNVTYSAFTAASSVALPTDFLRLAVITGKPGEWRHGVSEFTLPESSRYHQQGSEFAGIKGNASKPVAVLTVGESGKEVQLFPKTTGNIWYVPSVAANDSYDIEDGCYGAVIYKIAAIVSGIELSAAGVQALTALCNEQLGINAK